MGKTTLFVLFSLFFFSGNAIAATPIFYESFDNLASIQANGGIAKGLIFRGGIVGNAAKLEGYSYIEYPYENNFSPDAGTIQYLLNPESPDEGTFEVGLQNNENSLTIDIVYQYFDRPPIATLGFKIVKNNGFYHRLEHKEAEIIDGRWHLITAVWQCNQGENDFVQIYVNNVPGDKKTGNSVCTEFLEPATDKRIRIIHTRTSGKGEYDELKIYNYPKTRRTKNIQLSENVCRNRARL